MKKINEFEIIQKFLYFIWKSKSYLMDNIFIMNTKNY